ncbi:MAG: T9SS type A sorting domain-containing protein [Dysgonamonadaceae bacterium]|jgi:hypothetical protein|nr:T9SS type A sorting domain-containing protein [Dysgonamonadaceae bacterium]
MKNRFKKLLFPAILMMVAGNSPAQTNFTFTVPEGASVSVSAKTGATYTPFTQKEAISVSTSNGKTVYTYNLTGKHNYRVSKAGALTHVGVFTPGASATGLEFTNEQLASHNPKETDGDVSHLNGKNVADIFLNINEKGFLKLTSGSTYQLVNLRNWQAVDNDVNNYFIEPDYHYTVINENGEADHSVVAVSPSGLIRTVGAGVAIVLVTYDAMMCAHTTTVGNNGKAFFGALWPENTGVFVVSVDAPASGISTGMIINEDFNTDPTQKLATAAVDAELDVFYYLESAGGYDYTFKPQNVNSVTIAQPAIESTNYSSSRYTGFSTEGVTKNNDGSYTVHLIHGRNIVKLTAANGASEYQVLTAKPVRFTIENVSRPNDYFMPGDEIKVCFNTLFHPCNKLSGIYNMSAFIEYNGVPNGAAIVGGSNQYTFASNAATQSFSTAIPSDWNVAQDFSITKGVLKAKGYGDPYGGHRGITLEHGKDPNFSALIREATFGALPDIHIHLGENLTIPAIHSETPITVYPNPFTDYIIIHTNIAGKAMLFDLSGKIVLTENVNTGENRIDTHILNRGVYMLKVREKTVKIVK